MERTRVVSKTGMTGYAYAPETETLEISFASRKEGEPDRVYHYAAFKATDWAHFLAAESKGSWFIRVIKPKFACTKVEPEKTQDEKNSTSAVGADNAERTGKGIS